MKPRALILHAPGTNRDLEAAQAFELAGARPDIVPLNQLRAGSAYWRDYGLLCIPGGFSYADALGAGKLLAVDLNVYFAGQVQEFIEAGKPIIGICNGFQALVKAGLLPSCRPATLAFNERGLFECRWITLEPQSQNCLWTRSLTEPIYCPVAHGEGNFTLSSSEQDGDPFPQTQIALRYVRTDGSPASGEYPYNPNGSTADIAGICNPRGNVLGLMPHPEDHVFRYQHPRWTRGEHGGLGLKLFENGVNYARHS